MIIYSGFRAPMLRQRKPRLDRPAGNRQPFREISSAVNPEYCLA